MKVYVASSWRNNRQRSVVTALRFVGHEVYDFRNPAPGDHGFHWSNIDPAWQRWTPQQYIKGLRHPVAEDGFEKDLAAMRWADAFVLVGPCGRSAHLELGWAVGSGKRTVALIADGEPELMLKMVDLITSDLGEALDFLDAPPEEER